MNTPYSFQNGSMKLTQIHKNFAWDSTRAIFSIIFFSIFCFSGLLTMIDIFPYRMALVSLLALPLILFYGPQIDRVLIIYIGLLLITLFSALYNGSSMLEIALFLRTFLFSYLIYYLAERYINRATILYLINWCTKIGMVQLPILLLQRQTYDLLPNLIKADIAPVDYGFGTFNYKGDYAMGFFLLALLIFLLFDDKRSYAIKHKFLLIMWFTITILVANSEMNKLILVIVWVVYFAIKTNIKSLLQICFSLLLTFAILSTTGYLDTIITQLTFTMQSTQRQLSGNSGDINAFLQGEYSRGAALYYYFNQGISWLGDGPSQYTNAITREALRGNMGHAFTFYAETGLLGWLGSIILLYFITARPKPPHTQTHWIPILLFISIQMLSFTNQVLNDISIIMICCIIAKTHLIPTVNQLPNTKSTRYTALFFTG